MLAVCSAITIEATRGVRRNSLFLGNFCSGPERFRAIEGHLLLDRCSRIMGATSFQVERRPTINDDCTSVTLDKSVAVTRRQSDEIRAAFPVDDPFRLGSLILIPVTGNVAIRSVHYD